MTFKFHKHIAAMLMVSMLAMSLPAPSWARIVPTETQSPERDRVEQILVQYGVEPAQAKARAAVLTNEEAARVAAEFDALPAGGSFIEDPMLLAIIILAAVGGAGPEFFGAIFLAIGLGVVGKLMSASASSKRTAHGECGRYKNVGHAGDSSQSWFKGDMYVDRFVDCDSVAGNRQESNPRMADLTIDRSDDIELLGSEADWHKVLVSVNCEEGTLAFKSWRSSSEPDAEKAFDPQPVFTLKGMDPSDPLARAGEFICRI